MREQDIEALFKNGATIETKVIVLPDNTHNEPLILTNYDSVKDWVYKDFRYVEKQGVIGQFVARQLEGNFQDISDTFNIENREISLYLGIRTYEEDYTIDIESEILLVQDSDLLNIEEGLIPISTEGDFVTRWYCLGNFFVTKPESNEVNDNTKFEALDYTILFNPIFNGDYTDTNFPVSFNELVHNGETVTAYWLASYTCAQCGVELGSASWTWSDFEIDSNQFDSEDTCRDVIKAIAKLGYTWARIDWNNKLYFDFTVQNEVTSDYNILDNDYYYSLKTQKEKYGVVNRVLIGSSIIAGDNEVIEDSESIEENGLTELDIYDNPLTYTESLRQLAITKGNVLFGLTYTALDMETIGHPWLRGNELIEVRNMENEPLYTYPFDRTLKYTGHIKSQITSYAQTEIEDVYVDYNGTDKMSTQLKKTRIQLDKDEQKFTADIERIDDNVTKTFTTSKSITGYPIHIEDAGAYNLERGVIYGRTSQEQTPTSTNPVSIQNVKGINDIITINIDNGDIEEPETRHINFTFTDFLGKINDIEDTLDLATGTLVKHIGEYTFDGQENWVLNDENNDYISFYMNAQDIVMYENETSSDIRGISNYFKVIVGTNLTEEHIGLLQEYDPENEGSDIRRIYLTIAKSTLDEVSVEGLKDWLSELYRNHTPVVLQYLRNDDIITTIEHEAIPLYNGVNNITISSNLPITKMYVDYLTDSTLNTQYATKTQWEINRNGISSLIEKTTTLDTHISDVATSTNNQIQDVYKTLDDNVDTINNSITNITTSMSEVRDDISVQFDFQRSVETDGVKILDTQTGIRLDENGMTVNKSGSDTKTVVDEKGMNVYNTTGATDEVLLQVNTDGVSSENITVRTYLVVGGRSRFEDYSDGTGCFFIGGGN